MHAAWPYIAILIIALAVIFWIFFKGRGISQEKKYSPLASVAFAFVVAGIVFGENRFIGYGLLGTGLILALVDLVRKARK